MRPTEIFLQSNKPFFLEKNDHFWVVASGEVEIYHVKRNEKRELISSRNYLYTAQKGDVLFTLKTGEQFEASSLIAVSSSSKLIEVHKYFIGRLDKDQLSNKIERWVTALSVTIHQENKPKVYKDITRLGTLFLNQNQIAYPSKGLVWGKIVEGGITTYNDPKRLASEEATKNIFIPISKELRIKSNAKRTSIELFETRQIVEDEITLMLSVHHLQDYFLSEIKKYYEEKQNQASKSIQEKSLADESAVEGSLSDLKSIIHSADEQQTFSNIRSSNQLFATCQLIGQATGFDFTEPKFVRDYEHNITGRLSAIAQVSNVRTRKVILRGKWWEEENGHLLAFTKEDKKPVALIQSTYNSYLIKDVESRTSKQVGAEVAQSLDPVAYMFMYAFDGPMTSIRKIGNFAIKGLKKDKNYK